MECLLFLKIFNMKIKFIIILFFLIFAINNTFSQNKVGLYPIYFQNETEKDAFKDSYNLNGYNYIDEKHPLIAFVEQDTSWYWFDFRVANDFVKLPTGSGGLGAVSEITDTIITGSAEGETLIAKHNDGLGNIVGIRVPNFVYYDGTRPNKHIIGQVFANGDGLPKNIFETNTKIEMSGDTAVLYINENNDSLYVEPDKTIYGIPVSNTSPSTGQILKYNGSEYVPADDDISGGTGVDGVVNSAGFSGTTTKTLTLTRSNGLSNLTASFTDNVDDADNNTSNEIQALSKSGATISLSNGGGSISLNDDDATNEIQILSKSGTSLSLSNGGGSVTLGDEDNGNELQTISKSGNTITLSDGGGSVIDAVDDADNDPTNENQTVSEGWGVNVTHTGQDYKVEVDSTEVATLFDLDEKKDIFAYDFVAIKSLASNTETEFKQVTLGGTVYRAYTTVIGSYLEFMQGYIDRKSSGGSNFIIRLYKRSGSTTTLLSTTSVSLLGKTYFSKDYTGVSGSKFVEGDEFYFTVETDATTSEVVINYSIYFSRDSDSSWSGAPK